MPALPARPRHPADGLPVLGTRGQWMRDYALIGLLIGGLAPAIMWFTPLLGGGLSVLGGAAGVSTGAAFGWLAWESTERLRGRLPIPAMAAVLAGMGGVWGGLSGGLAGGLLAGGLGALDGDLGAAAMLWIFGAVMSGAVGAAVGAAVVGALWLPHAFASVMRLRRWPVFAGVAALSAAAAPAMMLVLGAM